MRYTYVGIKGTCINRKWSLIDNNCKCQHTVSLYKSNCFWSNMNQSGRPATLASGLPLWQKHINTIHEDLEGNTESLTDDEYTDSTSWKFAVISYEMSIWDSTRPITSSSCDTFDEYGEGLNIPSYPCRKDTIMEKAWQRFGRIFTKSQKSIGWHFERDGRYYEKDGKQPWRVIDKNRAGLSSILI